MWVNPGSQVSCFRMFSRSFFVDPDLHVAIPKTCFAFNFYPLYCGAFEAHRGKLNLAVLEASALRFHIKRSILSDFGFHPKPRFLNEMRPERHLRIFKVQSISVCARLYFQTDRKISRVGLKLWANTCFFFSSFLS